MVIGGQSSARKWSKEQSVRAEETEILPRPATMVKEQASLHAILCIIFSLVSEIIEILCRE
jgi:hypothetical protein